ncbi:MAG: clan AA aspartic protease [Elusimicrobiota bacterium]
MGEVFVKTKLINPVTRRTKEIKFLVDTGATISIVPEEILRSLHIKPIDKDNFELADGKTKVFKFGEATIKLNGKSRTFTVAFGARKSQPLLGLVVLETLGLKVDPVSGKLIKRHLMMYRVKG